MRYDKTGSLFCMQVSYSIKKSGFVIYIVVTNLDKNAKKQFQNMVINISRLRDFLFLFAPLRFTDFLVCRHDSQQQGISFYVRGICRRSWFSNRIRKSLHTFHDCDRRKLQ